MREETLSGWLDGVVLLPGDLYFIEVALPFMQANFAFEHIEVGGIEELFRWGDVGDVHRMNVHGIVEKQKACLIEREEADVSICYCT